MTITKKWNSKDDSCYKQDTIFIVKGKGLPEDGLRVVIPRNESSVTITGLTVGQTYTVTEDSGWSWRYTGDPTNGQITLVADKDANLIEFTNKLDRDNGKIYWLDDSDHKKNKFGVPNGN